MVMATISTTLTALKTSVDMAKTAVALRDDVKLAEATQLLNDKIIDVQNAALQLQEKVSTQREEIDTLKDDKREISAKLAELEKRKSERDRYEMKELVPGSFVLAYLPEETDSTPLHYLCQACMDNAGKKVVLQRIYHMVGHTLRCSACNTDYGTS